MACGSGRPIQTVDRLRSARSAGSVSEPNPCLALALDRERKGDMTDDTNGTTDLVVSHIFGAPVEAVWNIWTEESSVQKWWRVDGFSNILANMDVRENGVSHLGMRASEEYGGQDYYNVFQYTEVVPNRLLRYISNFADEAGNVISPEAAGLPGETPMDKQQQVEFEDRGDGTTKVTITEFGWLADGVMLERSKAGLQQTLANIDRALSE